MPGKKILLVDDDSLVADSVKMTLASEDCEIVYVDNGADAIRIYEPGRFDLVITDHRMPNMTGLQLAGHLKSINRAQPILLLTGFPPSDAHKVVDMVMVKPFANAVLRDAVSRLAKNGSPPVPN
jgi:CheY-like chemotaxis protein